MGQHDALGRALRARGEQNRRPIIGRAPGKWLLPAEEPAQLVGDRDGFADVLEIDDPDLRLHLRDQIFEPALLDEGARGDDSIDLRGTAGGKHIGGAGSEVNQSRHAPGRHRRQQSDDGGI